MNPAATPREPRAAWAVLALLSLGQLLGMSLWFTASATADHFRTLWQLSPGQVGGLTTAVQLGFVAGTAVAALLNLADLVPARTLFAISGVAAAIANVLLLPADSFHAALVLRFATGFFLAGVYPPAMKMAATWFQRARGLAIGTVVGALTVGKAAPYLVHAYAGDVHPSFVILSTSAGAVVAALLIFLLYRDGPYAFPRRAFNLALVATVLRHRETRLAIGAYLGHMWELYACWAALSVFFLQYYAHHGASDARAILLSGVTSFSAIAAGGAGSVLAGLWADRLGRERVAAAAMIVSGACSLVIGWLTGAPPLIVVLLALVWGFAVVADSAQFSALVTEVAPAHAVGTALTLQTSLGFLLTALSIWLTLALATSWGWGPALSLLAVGPAFGIWQILRLRQVRAG